LIEMMRYAKCRKPNRFYKQCEKWEKNNSQEMQVSSGELDNAKVCAVSRTERIATRGGRSSGHKTPRRTTYLDPKGKGDKSMSRLLAVGVKRGIAEDVYAMALQRLSDMAKAGIA